MKLIAIAAVAANGVIGNQGKLPWHLPADLQRFKELTTGHAVIMGRKTYESIGRELPNRTNFVVAAQAPPLGKFYWAQSLQQAIQGARILEHEKAFLIGGEQIYREGLPLCEEAYITRVEAEPVGDTFFPIDDGWKLAGSSVYPADNKNAHNLVFETWKRRTA